MTEGKIVALFNQSNTHVHTKPKKIPRTYKCEGFTILVEPSGIEPLTSTLPVLRSPS